MKKVENWGNRVGKEGIDGCGEGCEWRVKEGVRVKEGEGEVVCGEGKGRGGGRGKGGGTQMGKEAGRRG